jgi:hypothetical protein
MKKKCPKCNVIYENAENAFYKETRRHDGYAWTCKRCRSKSDNLYARRIRDKRRYAKNKDKALIRLKTRKHYQSQVFKCSALTCNDIATDLHHVSYDDYKAVVPLCNKHHRGLHSFENI